MLSVNITIIHNPVAVNDFDDILDNRLSSGNIRTGYESLVVDRLPTT
jgi:hypothetical protein